MHECIIIVSDDVVQNKQTTLQRVQRHADLRTGDVKQQRGSQLTLENTRSRWRDGWETKAWRTNCRRDRKQLRNLLSSSKVQSNLVLRPGQR